MCLHYLWSNSWNVTHITIQSHYFIFWNTWLTSLLLISAVSHHFEDIEKVLLLPLQPVMKYSKYKVFYPEDIYFTIILSQTKSFCSLWCRRKLKLRLHHATQTPSQNTQETRRCSSVLLYSYLYSEKQIRPVSLIRQWNELIHPILLKGTSYCHVQGPQVALDSHPLRSGIISTGHNLTPLSTVVTLFPGGRCRKHPPKVVTRMPPPEWQHQVQLKCSDNEVDHLHSRCNPGIESVTLSS